MVLNHFHVAHPRLIMVHRQIEIDLDEETDRKLGELARDCNGDMGQTLAGLVHAYESLESFTDQVEEVHRAALIAQLERSERDYREGRFVTWDEVKRRLNL
jgi:predicted transcriptional regulator